VVTVLVRVFDPVLLHVLKADQPLTTQLVHDCVSDNAGHGLPPTSAWVIVLVRVFDPVLLHVLKADQPLTSQSNVHARDSANAGHAVPPFTAAWVIGLVFVSKPVLLHVP